MNIDESLRRAILVDRDGYPYIIHPLTDGVPRAHPELLAEFVAWAKGQAPVQGATLIVAPEAMGIPLGVVLAMATGIPYVVVRKRRYKIPGEVAAYTETGYGKSTMYLNDVGPGDRVVVVDDVLSTGGTLDAVLATVKEKGAALQGAIVFLDKGEQAARLADHHEVPVATMRKVRIAAGRIEPVAG